MLRVNCHEPKEIINYLSAAEEVKVSNFTPGDYLIGNIAVERKTISDFLGSLVQKRLFEQLSRLKSCYPACFLIIEAFDLSYFKKPQVVYGAILRIMLELNIKVIFTQTKKQTAEVILLLSRRGKKKAKGKEKEDKIKNKRKSAPLRQRRFQLLESIPGIGRKRAKDLLKRFGTIEKVFAAKSEELKEVGSVGRKTVKSIRRVLR